MTAFLLFLAENKEKYVNIGWPLLYYFDMEIYLSVYLGVCEYTRFIIINGKRRQMFRGHTASANESLVQIDFGKMVECMLAGIIIINHVIGGW